MYGATKSKYHCANLPFNFSKFLNINGLYLQSPPAPFTRSAPLSPIGIVNGTSPGGRIYVCRQASTITRMSYLINRRIPNSLYKDSLCIPLGLRKDVVTYRDFNSAKNVGQDTFHCD